MDYKSALKAAIDGEKVRCKDWEDKRYYIYFKNMGFYGQNSVIDNISPSAWSFSCKEGIEWEVIKPEPKFELGEFVRVPNGKYARITEIGDYNSPTYWYRLYDGTATYDYEEKCLKEIK